VELDSVFVELKGQAQGSVVVIVQEEDEEGEEGEGGEGGENEGEGTSP
jgi:hypothetical protein